MAVEMPEMEETEMNMTPMIDIVFQLIVFFLLTLKFKSVDERIDSKLPKDRGIQSTSQFVDELPLITVKLFRENYDSSTEAPFTRVRVGQNYTFDLPAGEWTGKSDEDDKRLAAYEATFKQIKGAILAIKEQQNNPGVKGEIKTPRPKGTAVPHGDVVDVLNAFLDVGIDDVKFEGAPAPLPGYSPSGVKSGQ
jgi:Biopolymer transport protein ExbD/TolR